MLVSAAAPALLIKLRLDKVIFVSWFIADIYSGVF
jgi:hypothetical protein